MRTRWFLIALVSVAAVILLGWLMLAPPAQAQQQIPCAPRDALIEVLGSKYGERIVGVGVSTRSGALVELLVNEDGGSWTVLVTLPAGPTCIVEAGQAWEAVEGELPPDGDPL